MAGEQRVGMLETIREFALEQLAASGEEEATRRAHLDHFLGMANAQYTMFYLPGAQPDNDQHLSQERLAAEHANVRAALGWALERDLPAALRMAGELQWFWLLQGRIVEGLGWLEAALAHPAAQARTADRGMALNSAGFIAIHHGFPARAIPFLEEALAIRREVGDWLGVADTLNSLGYMALFQGDYPRAAALLEESIDLARELGHEIIIVASLGMLAEVVIELGDLDRATDLIDEGLLRARAIGDEMDTAAMLVNLGLIARLRGNLEQAVGHLDEALAIYRRLGGASFALQQLGRVLLARGDAATAVELLEDGLVLSQEAGDFECAVGCSEAIAQLGVTLGRHTESVRMLAAATAWRRESGVPRRSSDRREYEWALETARSALGEGAFSSAWASGALLPKERAMTEALALAHTLAGMTN